MTEWEEAAAASPADLEPVKPSRLSLLEWIPEVSREFKAPTHLAPWCSMIERAVSLESVRGLCAVPIRHHKTWTTIHGIAWALKRRPDLSFIYMTHSVHYAQNRGRDIRDFCKIHGVSVAKGHDTIQDWQTREGGGVVAMSAQESALGRDVDVLIVDDPFEGPDEAAKPDVRQRVDETIAFYTSRVPAKGSVLLIMSRFHPDDAVGRRLRRTAKKWEYVHSPALIDEGQPTERAFASDVMTVEDLKQRRAELREVDPRLLAWWSQFQNDPRADSGDYFHGPKRYAALPIDEGWRDVIGVDLAYSQSKKADFFALVLLRIWGSTAYVRKTERLKADMNVLEMAIRQTWHWNGSRCPVFSYVSGPEIGALAYFGDHGLTIQALRARYNKLVRAQKTIDFWNDGRILVPQGPEYDGFIGRCAAFRGVDGDDDDEVDALVSGIDGGMWSSDPQATRTIGRRRV